MTDAAARLRRIRELFDAIMDRPPEERRRGLDALATSDHELRADLLALVTRAERTDPRLVSPFDPGTAIPEDGADLVGRRLGPYQIVRLVGMGGMGAVYEAARDDDQYRKRVAIKLVQGGLSSAPTLARFRRERQILANLEHRNIATLLDGGVSPDGRPFLVMEYVEGEPITHWCRTGRRSIRERLALFRQVCGAVQHAHRNLVIHRDLKPGNILVTADGTVKLLDFGIATLIEGGDADDALPPTRGGARAFTPEYASPEQIRGDPLTTASDIYALGVVLFELLTGHRPHRSAGGTAAAVEHAVLEDPIPRPSTVVDDAAARACGEGDAERLRRRLSGELDSIVLMALCAEPGQRYPSVEALAEDVRRHLAGLPVHARRGRAGYLLRKTLIRYRTPIVASLLVIGALGGGVITTSIQARRARSAQLRAERVNEFLRGLLSSVKPSTGGRDVPVSELLDAAATRIRGELRDEPDIRMELETVIGRSYMSLGRYEAAEPHFRTALGLRERVDGVRSRSAAIGLSNLGGVFLQAGRLDAADSLFRAALGVEESLKPGADTLRASLLDNMGSLEHARGDPAAAERYHRESLELRRRHFGANSDNVAYSMNNVAVALGERERWAEAESLHRAAVEIFKFNHPGPSTLVADAENALATALDLQGKYDEADTVYREVLDQRRQLLGADHPDYAFTLFNYAAFLFDRGRFEEAARYSREVLALRGKTLPESHSAVAAALQTLGRCQDRLGDEAGADSALVESLALRRRYLPPGHWLIGSSLGVLGEHCTARGAYRRAETALLESHAILDAALGATSQRTEMSRRRLVSLYEAWGRPIEAARWRTLSDAPGP